MSKIFTHLLWSVYGISIKDRSCKSSYKDLYNGIISGSNQISSWASLSHPPYLLWSVFSNILVKFAILKWCKYLLIIITKLKRKKYPWSKAFFLFFLFYFGIPTKTNYVHSFQKGRKKKHSWKTTKNDLCELIIYFLQSYPLKLWSYPLKLQSYPLKLW